MSEEIILDRFEYKLPKGMYVVYKNSVGFKYRLKHSNMEFDSEDKCLEFIENTLKERKRYLQLIKTLNGSELSKLFSDVILLGLPPSKIKEYEAIEQFEYTLFIDDEWSNEENFKSLNEVKEYVAERVNLNFANYYLDLFSTEEVIVQGN